MRLYKASSMNIVIIDHEPYYFIKKSHYYIDEFLSEGWNVEYWAVNNALGYSKDVKYTYCDKDSFVQYFYSTKNIIESIKKFDPKDTIFIIELSFHSCTAKIYKTLYEHKYRWVRINYYENPTEYFRTKKTLKDKIEKIKVKAILKKIKDLPQRFSKKSCYNVPDILFLTGSKPTNIHAKAVVSLDYFDVQVYEDIKDTPPVLLFEYIVFLDVMLMSHPDIKRSGYDYRRYDKMYYDKLNALFNKIEEVTGLPIVIASHPKANYSNEFDNRKCIKHKTAELVIHSNSVLTHGSLSISFALFAKKPITFFYSEKLFSLNYFLREFLHGINNVSQRLGVEKINIDIESTPVLTKQANHEKYNKLLTELYLKTDVDHSNLEILKRSFTELLNKQ